MSRLAGFAPSVCLHAHGSVSVFVSESISLKCVRVAQHLWNLSRLPLFVCSLLTCFVFHCLDVHGV